jgi:hypothetical protein
VVFWAGLDTRLKEKSFASAEDQTPVVQSIVKRYTDWATPAPLLCLYAVQYMSHERMFQINIVDLTEIQILFLIFYISWHLGEWGGIENFHNLFIIACSVTVKL